MPYLLKVDQGSVGERPMGGDRVGNSSVKVSAPRRINSGLKNMSRGCHRESPLANPFCCWNLSRMDPNAGVLFMPVLICSQPAPLGHSWPTDGWLVLLGEGAPGWCPAGARAWLASAELSHHNVFGQPDLICADEDRLDQQGQRIDPWFKPDGLKRASGAVLG